MSAVLALYNRRGEPADRQVVASMLAGRPEHGVDGHDIWLSGAVALAHQHFWIVPEEMGERQPLVSEDGFAITADARLDNRAELLGALEDPAGGLSDAALLLRAYRHWGEACVERLLGDFALAVWDPRKRRLFLARDPLGARNLCYYLDQHRCLAATEISQILAHPSVPARFNEIKVAGFLSGIQDDHENTFYEGVNYCPPAHCLAITDQAVRLWRYWAVDPAARVRYRTDREYSEHFRELLTTAVRSRLRSAGPVGISLSGGLDSTSLAASATLLPETDLPQKRLKSFSYVFDAFPTCDERRYIRAVVERYGLEAEYLCADGEWTLRDLPSWPVDRDFVLSDAYARLPGMVRAAAQQAGCRVVLSGHYGDVLFTGGRFWCADLLREGRFGSLAAMLRHHTGAMQWRRDLLDHGLRQLVSPRLRHRWRRWRPRPLHPALHHGLVSRAGLRERSELEPFGEVRVPSERLQRYRGLMLSIFSQGLAAVRNAYARQGLELGMPYWDRRLVEFVMALPADQLGRPGRDRWVLRNALHDRLPSLVRERTRRTIFLPLLVKGLLEEENDAVEALLKNSRVVDYQWVNPDWLAMVLRRKRYADDTQDSYLLWLCLSLELWLRAYG